MITKIVNTIIFCLLMLSLSLNLFLWSNNEVKCDYIDSRWKADLLYAMGHRNLDWDKDWIPCENLPYKKAHDLPYNQ